MTKSTGTAPRPSAGRKSSPKRQPSTGDGRSPRGTIKREIFDLKVEKILEKAAELFGSQGYFGCSMEQVATALGVTKPFIYYHYKDKADLLAAVCQRGADLTLLATEKALEQSGSPADRLREFCRQFGEIILDYRGYIVVYQREVSSLRQEDRKRIIKVRAKTDALLASLLEQGRDAGELDLLDPAITATSLTGMLSFMTAWCRANNGEARDHALQTVVALAMRMVGARDTAA